MRENLMSGIDEGKLDKPGGEACILLYFDRYRALGGIAGGKTDVHFRQQKIVRQMQGFDKLPPGLGGKDQAAGDVCFLLLIGHLESDAVPAGAGEVIAGAKPPYVVREHRTGDKKKNNQCQQWGKSLPESHCVSPFL
jgi:hypothetical protein